MKLDSFPRRRYTLSPTPLERLERFSSVVGGPTVYMKRDDQLGLTEGGNKTRKLEFLVADAQAQGADTLVTAGGVQSNHCRLTMSAASREGMRCALVLEDGPVVSDETDFSGNYFLDHLLGANTITRVDNGANLAEEMNRIADELRDDGHIPYVIPVGGSNEIGATGYMRCVDEILCQLDESNVEASAVVCASGSGGMQAGLVAGLIARQRTIPVIGVNVSRGSSEQEKKVLKLVESVLDRVGSTESVPRESVFCIDEYVGPGYGLPTPGMVDAVRTMAKTEGILLDPVYTGKAAAGLIDLIEKERLDATGNAIFVHSGGVPALYARANLFRPTSM
ncbi:D-cysteine desulfhydrase [Brevibacterium sp. CFH 10365]|uniref:D-cysteine desulfhydrase n=1 Tax=Brevibacterium sp. CFH 10365 TaxID=2585207 RepID=UPI0012668759|nr:D-cysteine desulfhydrase [Brevibacterium sp. CFH 10365]